MLPQRHCLYWHLSCNTSSNLPGDAWRWQHSREWSSNLSVKAIPSLDAEGIRLIKNTAVLILSQICNSNLIFKQPGTKLTYEKRVLLYKLICKEFRKCPHWFVLLKLAALLGGCFRRKYSGFFLCFFLCFTNVTNVQQTFSSRDLKTPFRKEMCFSFPALLVSKGLITSVNLDPTSWPQGHQ